MNILLATSEAVPFAKTGGLADVSGALPVELARQGHSVAVIMPAHRSVHEAGVPIEPTGAEVSVAIGSKTVTGRILRSHLPGSDVPVYLIEQDDYFDRAGIYQEDNSDYIDNCERFVFFSRAVLESIRKLALKVDILHANDWPTGLVPAYLKTEYSGVPGYENIASVFTIHNLAYQGRFWHWDMVLTGLDWKYFNWRQMEYYGELNLMKTGLVFADALTTVSPTYAEEIQTEDQGCGLDGVLRENRDHLTGILNGIDPSVWNPTTDQHLAENYTIDSFQTGKARCKQALQQALALPTLERSALVGFVGRLVEQKGVELAIDVVARSLDRRDVQWVFLGHGDARLEAQLAELARRHPQRMAVRLEFSDALAHQIEGGADMFLMPSRYEPCGLNQMYSLAYGTVPLVHATGGLADTVVDATPDSLAADTATGIRFDAAWSQALEDALDRALAAYANPDVWSQIIRRGMSQDWTWARSARQYISTYEKTLSRVRNTVYS